MGQIDQKFMKMLGDYNAAYVDGSTFRPFSSANKRFVRGYAEGWKYPIPKLEPGETIKIVAHSQGVAVSAGFVKALKHRGIQVEMIYALAPFNPESFNFDNSQNVAQYQSITDIFVPFVKLKGVKRIKFPKSDFNASLLKLDLFRSHFIHNFDWIFRKRKTPKVSAGDLIYNGIIE